MLETYKAKLRGNNVVWNGEIPDAAKSSAEVEVYITILGKCSKSDAKRPSGLASGEFVVPKISMLLYPKMSCLVSKINESPS